MHEVTDWDGYRAVLARLCAPADGVPVVVVSTALPPPTSCSRHGPA
ncbi:hypothetical protein ABZX83_14630 [Streptomyces thermoviolaceus]